ncbi:hypothetical protein V8C86DRAFT_479091 [Haematococcus lacustris]
MGLFGSMLGWGQEVGQAAPPPTPTPHALAGLQGIGPGPGPAPPAAPLPPAADDFDDNLPLAVLKARRAAAAAAAKAGTAGSQAAVPSTGAAAAAATAAALGASLSPSLAAGNPTSSGLTAQPQPPAPSMPPGFALLPPLPPAPNGATKPVSSNTQSPAAGVLAGFSSGRGDPDGAWPEQQGAALAPDQDMTAPLAQLLLRPEEVHCLMRLLDVGDGAGGGRGVGKPGEGEKGSSFQITEGGPRYWAAAERRSVKAGLPSYMQDDDGSAAAEATAQHCRAMLGLDPSETHHLLLLAQALTQCTTTDPIAPPWTAPSSSSAAPYPAREGWGRGQGQQGAALAAGAGLDSGAELFLVNARLAAAQEHLAASGVSSAHPAQGQGSRPSNDTHDVASKVFRPLTVTLKGPGARSPALSPALSSALSLSSAPDTCLDTPGPPPPPSTSTSVLSSSRLGAAAGRGGAAGAGVAGRPAPASWSAYMGLLPGLSLVSLMRAAAAPPHSRSLCWKPPCPT